MIAWRSFTRRDAMPIYDDLSGLADAFRRHVCQPEPNMKKPVLMGMAGSQMGEIDRLYAEAKRPRRRRISKASKSVRVESI